MFTQRFQTEIAESGFIPSIARANDGRPVPIIFPGKQKTFELDIAFTLGKACELNASWIAP